MSIFSSSRAASLASLSAASLPSTPMCAFTHLKGIVQFSVAKCQIMFLIFSIRKPCIAWFFGGIYCHFAVSVLPDLLFSLTVPTPLSLVGGPLSGNGCGSPNYI
jgi:hypothetical protein